MTDYISRAAALGIIDPGHGDFHAGNYNAIAALPGIPAPGAEPVAWQGMETAPRDGTWFWAETARGNGRWVHFADRFDRFPINHDDNCWPTEPVRWRPDYPDAAPSVAALQAEVDKLRVDAKFWENRENEAVIRAERAEAALTEERAHAERLAGLIRWAHDTLWELNPSNYDHDEVCKVNDAAVEVILGLAPVLGETHGKSPEWWTAHEARKGG